MPVFPYYNQFSRNNRIPYYNNISPYNYRYAYGNNFSPSNLVSTSNSRTSSETSTSSNNTRSINKKSPNNNDVWFDLFGIKLYFDDVLILSLLFFLYKEEVKDEGLFLALVLLLIS